MRREKLLHYPWQALCTHSATLPSTPLGPCSCSQANMAWDALIGAWGGTAVQGRPNFLQEIWSERGSMLEPQKCELKSDCC